MNNSEASEISLHEVLVWKAFRQASGEWKTSKQVAKLLDGRVAARTVRAHSAKLQKLGVLDVAEVFPGHRYRLADKAARRNSSYVLRLQNAEEIFGADAK